MREKIRDKERLFHIKEAIENIFEFTQGFTFADFCNNKMMKFAVIKNFEIIGEAAYLLSKELKKQHTEIEWDDIVGMRHLLVHGYYHIKDEIVWATIQDNLLLLQNQIKQMIFSQTK